MASGCAGRFGSLGVGSGREGKQVKCCTWTLDDDYDGPSWDTACGEKFVFIDGGPMDNRVRYCPYCGEALEEVRPDPEDEDQ